jgi:hypothetical protein
MFNGYIIPTSVVFLGFLGILFYSWKEVIRRKRKKFSWIFNIKAPRSSDAQSITIFQPRIDKKLRELAVELQNAYGNNKEMETKRNEFCEANNSAQSFGFNVWGSPNCYLSQRLEF